VVAYDGQADVYAFLVNSGLLSKAESISKTKAAARRALELDDTLAEAHASLGLSAMNDDWDWPGAEQEFRRAIELNPHYATAHHWYGEFLGLMGRFDEAFAQNDLALEIDPLSPIVNSDRAKLLYFARRYDEAIEQCRRTLEIDPAFVQSHYWLAASYVGRGDYAKAILDLETLPEPDDTLAISANIGCLYARSGNRAEARKILAKLRESARHRYVSPTIFAHMYAELGDKDRAFEWFEKAYGERHVDLIGLKVNPGADALRGDPRVANLLDRIGLAR
jgi:Tfp pilus assembly protein PilF